MSGSIDQQPSVAPIKSKHPQSERESRRTQLSFDYKAPKGLPGRLLPTSICPARTGTRLALQGDEEASEQQHGLAAERRAQQHGAHTVEVLRGNRQPGQRQAAPDARQLRLPQQKRLRGRARAYAPDARLDLWAHMMISPVDLMKS